MSEIQRWECYDDHAIDFDDEGSLVSYEDHIAKIKALEAEKDWYKGTLTSIAVNSESDKTRDTAYRALQTIKESE